MSGHALPPREAALAWLIALHAAIDRKVARLGRRHQPRLRCRRGCSGCCVDEIAVWDVEAERIRRGASALLAEGSPHPVGACAMLADDGSCRIYEHRPYVCRTQGLPLRWISPARDGTLVEKRDICPLNDDGPPLEDLRSEDCWELGPIEGRLASIQRVWGGEQMLRVPLRALFDATR